MDQEEMLIASIQQVAKLDDMIAIERLVLSAWPMNPNTTTVPSGYQEQFNRIKALERARSALMRGATSTTPPSPTDPVDK